MALLCWPPSFSKPCRGLSVFLADSCSSACLKPLWEVRRMLGLVREGGTPTRSVLGCIVWHLTAQFSKKTASKDRLLRAHTLGSWLRCINSTQPMTFHVSDLALKAAYMLFSYYLFGFLIFLFEIKKGINRWQDLTITLIYPQVNEGGRRRGFPVFWHPLKVLLSAEKE